MCGLQHVAIPGIATSLMRIDAAGQTAGRQQKRRSPGTSTVPGFLCVSGRSHADILLCAATVFLQQKRPGAGRGGETFRSPHTWGVMESSPRLLFRTRHGSHLYGMNHDGSDEDWYEVWSSLEGGRVFHTIDGGRDLYRASLSYWLRLAGSGSPQALEAMFAPDQFVEVDLLAGLRAGYRVHTASALATYRRAIDDFAVSARPKVRRHSVRLAHDLAHLLALGWFDPTVFGRSPEADITLYRDWVLVSPGEPDGFPGLSADLRPVAIPAVAA